jgi:hypothetical protein
MSTANILKHCVSEIDIFFFNGHTLSMIAAPPWNLSGEGITLYSFHLTKETELIIEVSVVSV